VGPASHNMSWWGVDDDFRVHESIERFVAQRAGYVPLCLIRRGLLDAETLADVRLLACITDVRMAGMDGIELQAA